MNRIPFGEGGCEKTRRYMDAYLSSELLVETNHELLRHLEGCAACTAELEMRTRLRGRLKTAVQAQPVPPELAAQVRASLRRQEFPSRFAASWYRYAMGAAAMVLIAAAFWAVPGYTPLPPVSDRGAQATYIQKISAAVAPVFQPGLCDHIHCAVFRKYPENPPDMQELQQKLGVESQGLLPLVAQAIPAGYRVVLAHHCSYAGRRFVHLTMRKGTDVISLVISAKNDGESFSGLSPAAHASNMPLYQTSTESYQIAGFESDRYLAFVISNLKAGANLRIAASLAPPVGRLLGESAPRPLL